MKLVLSMTAMGILLAGCASAPNLPETASTTSDQPTSTYKVQSVEPNEFPDGLQPPGQKNNKPPQHTPGTFPGR